MKGLDRDALLLSRKSNTGLLNRAPFIVTYHPCLPPLNSILRKHSPILDVSKRLGRAVSNPPLVTYHRPPNYKNLLVRATFKQQQPSYKGNSQCRQARCKRANILNEWINLTVRSQGRFIKWKPQQIVKHLMWSTLLIVINVKKQYVGETDNALHVEMNGHRSDIKHWHLEKPVAKHFSSMAHSIQDLSGYVIEKVHREEAIFRKVKESHWIQTLWTLAPEGLNLESYAS